MDGWLLTICLYGQLDIWTAGWMDGWMDGWMEGGMEGGMDTWTDGRAGVSNLNNQIKERINT